VMAGGVDSGFHHVKPDEYKPRLLHISGYQKHVQVSQIALKTESLNDSETFILDAGLKMWQFNGSKSTVWEKRKANAVMDEIIAARNGKVQKSFIIDGINDKSSPVIEDFWKFFGGRPKAISDAAEVKEAPDVELTLQRVSDASGVLEIKEVSRGKLDKTKLSSDDVFIVDAGGHIFVWIGKNSSKNEKAQAMAYALHYLQKQERSADVPICRVIDGKETKEFWEAFGGQSIGGRQHQIHEWKK